MDTVLVADASPRQLARRVDQLAGLPIRVDAVNTLDGVLNRLAGPPVHAVVAGSNVSTDLPASIARALRESPQPDPAIVMVLGRAEVLGVDAVIEAGADDVLVSPFDASLLANKVELAVKLTARRRSSGGLAWPASADGTEADRRRFVRQSVCEPLGLREPGDDAFVSGLLLDVSEAAAKFQSLRRVSLDGRVEFRCPFLADLLDWGGRPLRTRVIRRIQQPSANVYAASLVGIGDGETHRVRRWIFAEQARRVRVPGPGRADDRSRSS